MSRWPDTNECGCCPACQCGCHAAEVEARVEATIAAAAECGLCQDLGEALDRLVGKEEV